jgi:hypothetical protein
VSTPRAGKTLPHARSGNGKEKNARLRVSRMGIKEVHPEQVAPLDGEEFKDF